MAEKLTFKQMEPGEIVMTQGDKGDKFYFIIKGKVSIFVDN